MADEIRFDWDKANTSHLARHRVSRDEAEEAVINGFVELEYQFVNGEERFLVVGRTSQGRFLTLTLTYREAGMRPVTAWDATPEEEAAYWRGV